MTRKCRTTPEEALAQYIQLGQGRTLHKVYKILANSVSYDSLKRWCHQGNWVEKAKATDRKTTEIMTEKHAIDPNRYRSCLVVLTQGMRLLT